MDDVFVSQKTDPKRVKEAEAVPDPDHEVDPEAGADVPGLAQAAEVGPEAVLAAVGPVAEVSVGANPSPNLGRDLNQNLGREAKVSPGASLQIYPRKTVTTKAMIKRLQHLILDLGLSTMKMTMYSRLSSVQIYFLCLLFSMLFTKQGVHYFVIGL